MRSGFRNIYLERLVLPVCEPSVLLRDLSGVRLYEYCRHGDATIIFLSVARTRSVALV